MPILGYLWVEEKTTLGERRKGHSFAVLKLVLGS